MPAGRGLRLPPALLQHQSGCQQLSAVCLPGCEALLTGLPDGLAGGAQARGVASRGLATLNNTSACTAAPGCRCNACSARRVCKAAPGCRCMACAARQQSRDDPVMTAAVQSRRRSQSSASGASTADTWQHGRHASATAANRPYSTFAAAPVLLRRIQRVSPTVLPGVQHSSAQSACRSYSTLEECQPEVRDHGPSV